MQIMLNALSMWCTENCMSINTSKSKLVHFRPQSMPNQNLYIITKSLIYKLNNMGDKRHLVSNHCLHQTNQ
jgi:hypothetical protein